MKMVNLSKINMVLRKLIVTLQDFKKTAYHHYGENPISLLKFLYYSGMRINTFYVYENDLTRELPYHNLGPEYTVLKPSLEQLAKIREGKDLPREFYYDKIYNLRTCYIVLKGVELAKIYWVIFKNDYNRFLILEDKTAELNYNTTLPKFRGKQLMAKMMAYISAELKEMGYQKAMGVIHELNSPALRAIENAGFKRVGSIKTLGPFNRRRRVIEQ